jgi:hypothetical protein
MIAACSGGGTFGLTRDDVMRIIIAVTTSKIRKLLYVRCAEDRRVSCKDFARALDLLLSGAILSCPLTVKTLAF